MAVTAAFSFPRVTRNNLVWLSGDRGELDFAPIPFFWAHALTTIRELGGTVLRAVPPDTNYNAVPWQRLSHWDRARILMGFGSRVR